MRDLIALPGIGTASARALVAAGIADVAALATVSPSDPPAAAAEALPRADWVAWVAAAQATLAARTDGEGTPREEGGPEAAAETAPARTGGAPPLPAIRVRGPERGFRRAGRLFGPAWTVIAMAELTDDELAALRAEPRLVVEPTVTMPAPAAG